METVTLTRTFDADPDAVRSVVDDPVAFLRAAGFDGVEREGDTVTIRNDVALAEIRLVVDLVDDPDAVLAYEQRRGIFDTMRTTFTLEAREGGCALTARTDFSLGRGALGDVLDATLISRQRRRELEAQFDYVADAVA